MSEPSIDSNLSLDEALMNLEVPSDVKSTLILLDIPHLGFDGLLHRGQLVVHKEIEKEVQEIFSKLLALQFPIQKIIPIVKYDWEDTRSMSDNNTSAFNYRKILGTDRLSNHSFGRALDINPVQNPYFARDSVSYPEGAVYDTTKAGTIEKEGVVVKLFKSYGWVWGGDWTTPVDYQHFEKPIA